MYQADGTTLLTAPINIAGTSSASFVVKVTVPPGASNGTTDTQGFSVTSAGGAPPLNFSLTTTAIAPIPGDNIANAFVIPSLPFTATGTTVGFNHHYGPYGDATGLINLINPYTSYYSGSTLGGPDVVYQLTLTGPTLLSIDLFGSQYDTSLGMVTAPGTNPADVLLINDDYYSTPVNYVSYVNSGANFVPAGTYYIIIGGYSTASGAYTLTVTSYPAPAAPTVAIQANTTANEVLLSWTQAANQTYNIYSDTNPYGSFSTVVATGVNAGSFTITPIPAVNTFYRVTEIFAFPPTRSPGVIDALTQKK